MLICASSSDAKYLTVQDHVIASSSPSTKLRSRLWALVTFDRCDKPIYLYPGWLQTVDVNEDMDINAIQPARTVEAF